MCIFIVIVFFIGQSQQDKSDIKIHDFFFTKACRLHTEGSRIIIVKKIINEAKRMQCPQNLKFSQRFVLTQNNVRIDKLLISMRKTGYKRVKSDILFLTSFIYNGCVEIFFTVKAQCIIIFGNVFSGTNPNRQKHAFKI